MIGEGAVNATDGAAVSVPGANVAASGAGANPGSAGISQLKNHLQTDNPAANKVINNYC